MQQEVEKRPLPPPGSWCNRSTKFLRSWFGVMFHYLFHPYSIYREVFKRPKLFSEIPDRSGETVVLTGGTRGIGLKVFQKLLQSGFNVILGCRSVAAGEKVIQQIRESGLTKGSTKVFELDLMSLESVRKFAAEVLQNVERIDLLINNAGIMFGPYSLTKDGYETQFQVNYLSHFLLTNLLLDKIKDTSKRMDKDVACRIINVSSDANFGGCIDFGDLEKCQIFASNKSYSDSKLCQIMHAKYLDKILRAEDSKVNVYSLHPGVIISELWINVGAMAYTFVNCIKSLFRSPEDGANTIIYTALSPELEGIGGVYINSCEVEEPQRQAADAEILKQLNDRSFELVK